MVPVGYAYGFSRIGCTQWVWVTVLSAAARRVRQKLANDQLMPKFFVAASGGET